MSAAARRSVLLSSGGGWTRGGTSEVVRRAHPASGAQWNVQVVRGKVNGKCLWNACKALSLGLLLMVLGAAMATIGYYADQLSVAQETRGNHTVAVRNESRGFHLNNLSYAGPIVMGVGGFIVVAACVMTFEARDSAAKVVPARLKLSTNVAPSGTHHNSSRAVYNSASSQTAANVSASNNHRQGSLHVHHHHHHSHNNNNKSSDRHAVTQSFLQFSRGLTVDTKKVGKLKYVTGNSPSGTRSSSLKVPQGSINRSPSAPDLILDNNKSTPGGSKDTLIQIQNENLAAFKNSSLIAQRHSSRRTFAACALLNPGLLQRHAISVDESTGSYRSNDSLQHNNNNDGARGSQSSVTKADLHLEQVTLKIYDKRRNPLKRQKNIEEEHDNNVRKSSQHSHTCSPRLSGTHLKEIQNDGLIHNLPHHHNSHKSHRRSSNSSDCTHRSRNRRRQSNSCHNARGKLERAISSDSRLTGTIPKCYHSHEPSRDNSTEHEHHADREDIFNSENDIRKSHHHAMVHFSPIING